MDEDHEIDDLLAAAINSADSTDLIQKFNLNYFNEEQLEYIYEKLGEYISVESLNSENLAEEANLISKSLGVLWEVISDLKINNVILSLNIAKQMLPLITDELCSIKNMKKALHIFNETIKMPNIANNILTDDTFEGYLQILGRKVSSVGDYECQAAFIEVLCQIANHEGSMYWVNVWFPEPKARFMFKDIEPEKFESSLRQLLNYVNRNEPDRRVFSFMAQYVTFGSFQLKKPKECDMWIDFNYDSQSISFYCAECNSFENASGYQEMWETVIIEYSSLAWYSIKDRKAEKKKEVILSLNCPCYTLTTLTQPPNPEFQTNQITIMFWDVLDIYPHLAAVYGRGKHRAENKTKISTSTDIVDISDEMRDAPSQEFSSQRKVSDISSPICIDVCENEVFFPDSDLNPNFNMCKKISHSTEAVQFTAEDIRSLGAKKVSESTELIQVDISMISKDEKQKDKRSSISVNSIFYETNADDSNDENFESENESLQQENGIDTGNENLISETGQNLSTEKVDQASRTELKCSNCIGSQRIGDKMEKRASTSSKETDNSESSSKFQRKKVRLYNLESAPVYDVPPVNNINDTYQENVPCKSDLLETNGESIPGNNVKISELRAKRKDESEGQKSCGRRKRIKSLNRNEIPIRAQTTQHFDKLPVSDEDFQENTLRDSVTRRKKNLEEKQRKAAVKAMKKTKEILDRTSEVALDISVYDIIEDIDELEKNGGHTSKTFKRKLSKSDTDTHSSEVSWIKKRKSYLFESPKKTYTEWRKSLRKKKELSVQVRPDSPIKKTPARKMSHKSRRETDKSDSNIDAKSLGFSELENYNLTVEKNGNRSPHPVIKVFDFRKSKVNVPRKSLQTIDQDSDSEIDHPVKKLKNKREVPRAGQKIKTAPLSAISNDAENCRNAENDFNDEPDYDGGHAASLTEHAESCFEEENEERERTESKNTSEDVGEPLIGGRPLDKIDTVAERLGKVLMMQRFLKSVSDYSEKGKESIKSTLSKPESISDSCPSNHASKSSHNGIEMAELDEGMVNPVAQDDNLTVQHPYNENTEKLEELKNAGNQKDQPPPVLPTKRKRSSSEGLDMIQTSHRNHQVSEKATSMEHATSSGSFLASNEKLLKRSKTADKETKRMSPSSFKKSGLKQDEFLLSKKWNRKKKSKDFKNRNFSSLSSQLSSSSMMDALKDKKWFQDITSLLSQNACNLSKKLLATVQVCYFEYCNKMSSLRENLVKTAKIFELPLSQDTSEYKLKSLFKSYKIARLEVEKSLIRMRSTAKEYLYAEERDYKSLRKKQIKANQKFTQSMQKIGHSSIKKLEQKVLLKTKYFMKKFQMHIDSM